MQQSQVRCAGLREWGCRQQEQTWSGVSNACKHAIRRVIRSRYVCEQVRLVDDQKIRSAELRPPFNVAMTDDLDARSEVAEVELVPKFRAPLLDQRIGADDANLPCGVIDKRLPDDESRLDGLAHPDLVSEQVSLYRIPDDAEGCGNLM